MLEEEEAPVYTIKKRWWWIRGLLLEETLDRLSGTCLKRSGSEIYIVKKRLKSSLGPPRGCRCGIFSLVLLGRSIFWVKTRVMCKGGNVAAAERRPGDAESHLSSSSSSSSSIRLYSDLLFLLSFLKKVLSLQSCIFNNRRIFDALNNGIGVRTQVRYSSALPSAKFCAKRW